MAAASSAPMSGLPVGARAGRGEAWPGADHMPFHSGAGWVAGAAGRRIGGTGAAAAGGAAGAAGRSAGGAASRESRYS